jgi:hypothetical protein
VEEAVPGRGGLAARHPVGRASRPAYFQITSSEIANTCSQHWNGDYPFTYMPVT